MVIRPRLARPVFALCTLATCAAPLAAQRWQMQYLYGEAKSALSIVDIQCPSASRCVAAGVITQGGRVKFVALVTSDGGAHWRTVTLKERPLSLFFLNEGFGWMVTEKGLWRTAEAGKSWTKLPNVRAPELGGSISLNAKGLHMLHNARAPVLRVLFAGENNGWAVCGNKTVLKTHDGARHWSSVRAAAEPPGDPRSSAYRWIAFATPQAGLIVGSTNPPPSGSLALGTTDGGNTWKSLPGSIFGEITLVRFGGAGTGLGLIEHAPSSQYPSEVLSLSWPSGKNEVVYRDESFSVRDVWVTPGGVYYLAGLMAAGRRPSLVPQKVKVLKSSDLKEWTPVAADDRAVANRAMLAGAGEDLWLATDNGMILKLAP
jgi:hypothetical protein